MYVGPDNPGFKYIKALYKSKLDSNEEVAISVEGVQGKILVADELTKIGKYEIKKICKIEVFDKNL